jgi:hypothetical protein
MKRGESSEILGCVSVESYQTALFINPGHLGTYLVIRSCGFPWAVGSQRKRC